MKRDAKMTFGALLRILAGFAALAVFLLLERNGIHYESVRHSQVYLSEEQLSAMKFCGDEADCLVLIDSRQADSQNAEVQFKQILTDMRVPYELCDVAQDTVPSFETYDTAVVLISDISILGEDVLDLCSWVSEGGRAMFALPLQKTSVVDMIAGKLGILEIGYEFCNVADLEIHEEFMLGSDRIYQITDPYESAASVMLNETCQVYASASDGKVPLIWTSEYKNGRFVMVNFGYCEKAYRGIYAAAYSLLESVCIYPVINGSAFYIDDFPSPVPSGEGKYIKRDYGMEIGEFYSSVWWPDMVNLAKTYGLYYTGMIIENYDNQVSGDLPRNSDTARYNYFGNMLLNMGGELGFHGYNHQPLCLDDFVYTVDLGYKKWDSMEEMKDAVRELGEFSKDLFPAEEFSVYVPPSNVLSPEGREMLVDDFPEIRSIASIYFPGESAYEQEFEVAEDGIVETPRIISGCSIDDYMSLAALSELNFHYVNSHFLHPDDLMDEDRGAVKGWEELKKEWNSYLTWLYDAAPQIRNLTGSQMAGAVQRYCNLSLRKEDTQEDLYLTVDGIVDEAYLFVRVNEGELGEVSGGELTHLTGNLYLLRATEPEIEIKRNR